MRPQSLNRNSEIALESPPNFGIWFKNNRTDYRVRRVTLLNSRASFPVVIQERAVPGL